MAPGIYRDVPSDVYHAWPFLSSHRLAMLDRSPAHLQIELANPRPQTPAMARGEAVHLACLQPDLFHQWYVVSPKFDRRTTKGKADAAEFEAANAGKEVISQDEWCQYRAMSDAVWEHLAAGKLLRGELDIEVSGIFDRDGIRCKLRADFVNRSISAICDLKTCEDGSIDAFQSSVAKFNYYRQAAFYLDGLAALGQPMKHFVFIAVESDPPHAVAVYRLDPDAIEAGRKINNSLMAVYRQCLKSGEWPAYSPMVQDIGLPAWLQRRIENNYL
jgi:hypothetical protein